MNILFFNRVDLQILEFLEMVSNLKYLNCLKYLDLF